MRSFQRARMFVPLLLALFACFVPQARALWDCGMRKITTENLLFGGEEAKAGSFPWHAAIYHWNGNTFDYQCGGSIIDSNLILTSAHCIYSQNGLKKTSDIRVELGRTKLNSTIDPAQVYNVTTLIPHPNFRPDSVSDAIALIQLGSDIKMTKFVQPICLWSEDSRLDSVVGRNGSVLGFGKTELVKLSNDLREALVEVTDSWTCIESDPDVYEQNLNPNMFCARGRRNISACQGDTGSGLAFEDEGRWFIRGILSFIPRHDGFDSCDTTKHTVLTDAAKYRQWMAQYVQPSVMSASNEFSHDSSPKLKLFNLDTCGVALNKTSDDDYKEDDDEEDDYEDYYFDELQLLKLYKIAFSGVLSYPWLGLLEAHYSDDNVRRECQVTLINEWYAVGPAHCFSDVRVRYTVLLGIQNKDEAFSCIRNTSEICPYRHSIEEVFKHPRINLTSFIHNIALIELGQPANVIPICLPVITALRSYKPVPSVGPWLRIGSYTKLPAIDVNVTYCQNQYKSTGNTHFCASLETVTKNLPGAPIQVNLTYLETDRFVLRGFAIFGRNDYNNTPSVFNNIESYISWMLYKMKNK